MDNNELIAEYRATKEEYLPPADEVLDKDPDQVRISKRILAKLPQVDRTLFILYADCQSYRKLGKALGLSHMTARKEILRIRQTILEEYAKETRK